MFLTSFSQQKKQVGTNEDFEKTVYMAGIDTAFREINLEGNEYIVKYIYNSFFFFVPSTFPPGPYHYDATIFVYNKKLPCAQIGKEIKGVYVREGCFEDAPETFIKLALLEQKKQKYRKHVPGMTFTTYPPIYSCNFCHSEFSPYQFLPKEYIDMKIPMAVGKDTFYWNGYGRFCDSLKKLKINEDSFFFERWNEEDTNCLSNEMKIIKSESVWNNWLKTHKKGKYFIDKTTWMNTNNCMGDENHVMGGRFSDEVLLIDKWYKIVYDKKK